jgi:hypothetical protein
MIMPPAEFGRRDRTAVWSDMRGRALSFRVAPVRVAISVGALFAVAAAAVLGAWRIHSVSGFDPVMVLPLALLGLVGMAALAGAVLVARIGVRTTPLLEADPQRLVIRTPRGRLVLPWSEVELSTGRLFARIRALGEAGREETVLVPTFLLRGGKASVEAAFAGLGNAAARRGPLSV